MNLLLPLRGFIVATLALSVVFGAPARGQSSYTETVDFIVSRLRLANGCGGCFSPRFVGGRSRFSYQNDVFSSLMTNDSGATLIEIPMRSVTGGDVRTNSAGRVYIEIYTKADAVHVINRGDGGNSDERDSSAQYSFDPSYQAQLETVGPALQRLAAMNGR